MGASGSAAESPTQPDAASADGLRASDAERDEVVSRLREEFAAGRLSQDTFLHRMNAVLEARHMADLPPLLADLPAALESSSPPPAPRRVHHHRPPCNQCSVGCAPRGRDGCGPVKPCRRAPIPSGRLARFAG